ncbi:MAG TPA: sigma 54-interacting transcriptional regulator [Thermoanaerobaculia bacterium]|nr:sigma 54-interacting transcriptional regulator [Thermoanaerobaculia bacterium]
MSASRPAADASPEAALRRFRRLFPTRSPRLREVLVTAAKVLPTDASVMVLGESGTGKDYFAEALHACGARGERPFVRIDCAALPEDLFEAELFGYEKGAFTDASIRKQGRIELAQGGTLYFDEIASLAPRLQAKLLRLLQERHFSRLGDSRTIDVDVRVISSSNLASTDLSDERHFRKDLYYRLNVVSFILPPLRERIEDVPSLAAAFLRDAAKRYGRKLDGFEPRALDILRDYHWPGNLREMKNAIERAVIVETSSRIRPESLPTDRFFGEGDVLRTAAAANWTLEQLERRYVEEILRQTRSNQTRAAAILGISRKTLLEKRKKWGL